MAGAITHFIHGEKVLSYLTLSNTELNIDKEAFYWGTQGPDFLYYHRALPWMKGESLKNIGKELNKTELTTILEASCVYIEANSSNIYSSYIYGLICHYCLDTTILPYVEYLSEKLLKEKENETPSSVHTDIESSLDTIILRKEKEELPTERNLKEYFPKNHQVQQSVSLLYKFLIKQILSKDIDEKVIFQATEDVHKVFSWLTDRTSFKKNFMSKLEIGGAHKISAHIRPFLEDMEIDYANIIKEEWTDLDGNINNLDFFELVEIAKEKAVRITDDIKK